MGGHTGETQGETLGGHWRLTRVDDHVPAQVVGQIKPLPAARLGALLGPALAVHQVDVILEVGEVRGAPGPQEGTGGPQGSHTWKLLSAT